MTSTPSSPSTNPNASDSAKEYVCVNCMARVDSLYTQYSKDVIRITDCPQCKMTADKYIEYDEVLIVNDLFLQYSAAYRHLLLNTNFQKYPRVGMLCVLADAYNKWIVRRSALKLDRLYDLEWSFYECVTQGTLEFMSFLLASYCLSYLILGASKMHKFPFFLGRSVVGFFGNVFIVFSIIWRLHEHLSYRLLTGFFIFISHMQVHQTLCSSLSTWVSLLIVLFSTGVQQLVGWGFNQFIHF